MLVRPLSRPKIPVGDAPGGGGSMVRDQGSRDACSESLSVSLESSGDDAGVKITGAQGDSYDKKEVQDFPVSS